MPRLELPGIPLHVTQRGVNRCAIFLDDDDRHWGIDDIALYSRARRSSIEGPGS